MTMHFEGQLAVDTIIFILAVAFSLVCVGHIFMLWSLRRNFFIVLRSPRLACALGLSSTLHYLSLMYVLTINSTGGSTRRAGIAHLLSVPALLIAEVSLILTAVRLMVMYYPQERARWGRFTKELPLTYGLAFLYFSMEVAVWSVAWSEGMTRVAAVVKSLKPLSAIITIVAAVSLGGRLKRVDDASNMSRDIRLVGSVLLGIIGLQTIFAIAPMPFLARKYINIGLLFVSNPTFNWICVIRPAREVVRNIPEGRRSTVEALLLVTPHRRTSSGSVAVTINPDYLPYRKGSARDDNRLCAIMSFLPLREAFGEFCRKSLCSESFQFLLDVSEFQSELVQNEFGNGEQGFKGFGSYLSIVNDYIKDGAHSEVNIEFRTKRNITRYAKFAAYAALDLEGRREIFSDAAEEIGKMLVDNLLNRFLTSAQYKAVVDFEVQSPR